MKATRSSSDWAATHRATYAVDLPPARGSDCAAESLRSACELAALQRRMVRDLEQFLSDSLASRGAEGGHFALRRAS